MASSPKDVFHFLHKQYSSCKSAWPLLFFWLVVIHNCDVYFGILAFSTDIDRTKSNFCQSASLKWHHVQSALSRFFQLSSQKWLLFAAKIDSGKNHLLVVCCYLCLYFGLEKDGESLQAFFHIAPFHFQMLLKQQHMSTEVKQSNQSPLDCVS